MPRRTRPERRRSPGLTAVLLLGLCCLAGAAEAAPLARGGALSGRYRAGVGALHRGGRFALRALDAQRVSLRLELPDQPLLARRQYLVKEGGALLSWSEPLGGGELLPAASPWRELLAALPAAAWTALLLGDGEALSACLEPGSGAPDPGEARRRGRLAGREATVRLRGGRLLALRWSSPQGELRFSWQELAGGGGWLLRVRGAQAGWLRITARRPREGGVDSADWLFLDATGNRAREAGVPAAHP
ncbi:hypothetical protein FJ251_00860 [bacterium]|nr:hypothetical protein [bacterium]